MKTGLTISTVGHAALLLWGLVSFAANPLDAKSTESMPIDIISTSEFSQLRAGKLDAPKVEKPKPMVEKVAEPRPQTNAAQKIVEKPDIVSSFAPAPPPPEAKIPEPKRPPPEAKAEPKPKEPEKKEPDHKPDAIAEALKQDEAKKKPERKPEEAKKPEHKPEPKEARKPEPKPEPKKPETAKPQPKFDADRIAALLDKREPQRQAALGDTINRSPALGARSGDSAQLSQNEIDAFRNKLKSCWNPPTGALNAEKIKVPITIRLKPDRTLAGAPLVEMSARDAYTQAMIDSAVRAIIQCQPYAMFSPQRYEVWKEIPLDFNPVEMFGG